MWFGCVRVCACVCVCVCVEREEKKRMRVERCRKNMFIRAAPMWVKTEKTQKSPNICAHTLTHTLRN